MKIFFYVIWWKMTQQLFRNVECFEAFRTWARPRPFSLHFRCLCSHWSTFRWFIDSIKDKVTFRSSPNRTSVLDPSIFRISVPFLFNYQIFLQSIAENDKKWPKYPDYLFSHNCGQLNYIWLEKLQQYLGFIRNNSC